MDLYATVDIDSHVFADTRASVNHLSAVVSVLSSDSSKIKIYVGHLVIHYVRGITLSSTSGAAAAVPG